MAAMVVCLWVFALLGAANFAASGNIFPDKEEQCMVNLIVNMALQLQEQSNELKQLSAQLKQQDAQIIEQSTQLQQKSNELRSLQHKVDSVEASQEQNTANLTNLSKAHSEQDRILQQQSGELRSLQHKMESVEASQERNTANLTDLSKAHSEQDRILQQQSGELRSLQHKMESVEASQERNTANLTDLSKAHSEQDSVHKRQAEELRSLRDKVHSVDWITGNLTALNNTHVKPAFRAMLPRSIRLGTAATPILFEMEFTSTGEGRYDADTGSYTVAIPGVYWFRAQLSTVYTGPFYLDVVVNGTVQIRSACADGINNYPTTCAASSLLHLGKGDRVWVLASEGGRYYYGPQSFFSGALISPDP